MCSGPIPGIFLKMEAKKFDIRNFIHVPGFAIIELGLSGNELLCYSLIYGFSQDGETEFVGSLNYVSSALNVTRQNAKKIIDRLIERGLVEKRETYFQGVKFCRYVAKSNGVAESATGGVAEIATNDNIKDNIRDSNNIPDEGLFQNDTGFETVAVKRPRRTSEAVCLFENSRFYNYDLFAAEFKSPEFEGIDISYYYHAVADWSSQKGKKMRDWIATARNFIRADLERGKPHRISGAGLSPEAIKYLQDMVD